MARRASDFDWLIVGAGFTGAVIAERLATAGQRVFIIDKRTHLAGNAYDYVNEYGVLCHAYGPHIFHTSSDTIFSYLSRFTEWLPYEHRVRAKLMGGLIPVPFSFTSLDQLFPARKEALKEKLIASLGLGANIPIMKLMQSADLEVATLANFIYENVFLGYTRKQWGMDPSELEPSVMARVPIRLSYDDRYFQDTFQAMPRHGYAEMFKRILNHDNIVISLGVDYDQVRAEFIDMPTVFSGAIDEFFGFELGPLPYRSLRFEFSTLAQKRFQQVAQVNYPGTEPYTRITEMPLLTQQDCARTTIAIEFPIPHEPGRTIPYYPVPQEGNKLIHKQYIALAREIAPHVHFAGRLGEYRYYNMDQAVGAALTFANRWLDRARRRR